MGGVFKYVFLPKTSFKAVENSKFSIKSKRGWEERKNKDKIKKKSLYGFLVQKTCFHAGKKIKIKKK